MTIEPVAVDRHRATAAASSRSTTCRSALVTAQTPFRRSSRSTSPLVPATSSRSSVPRAAARARCSTSWRASKRRLPAARPSMARRSPVPVRTRCRVPARRPVQLDVGTRQRRLWPARTGDRASADARASAGRYLELVGLTGIRTAAIRTSFPAACSNASASPARWRTSPKCC